MKHIYGIQFIDHDGSKFGSTIIFTNKKDAIDFANKRRNCEYATHCWFQTYLKDEKTKGLFAYTKTLW